MRSALLQLVSVATVLASTSALAGPIIVHIQGPDGKPVAGASVAVPELMRKGTTGTDGSAALPDLPDRNVAVAVSAPGFKPALQSALVSGKSTSLNVQLERSNALQRAVQAHGEPAVEHLAQKQAYLNGIKPAAGKKPNIVLVLFDDLGFGDLSSHGKPRVYARALCASGREQEVLTLVTLGDA